MNSLPCTEEAGARPDPAKAPKRSSPHGPKFADYDPNAGNKARPPAPKSDGDRSQVRYLGEVQRLALQPGDILVLKLPHAVTAEIAESLKGSLKSVLGEERKIIVLDAGTEIGVLSENQAA